jgi:hypothetical protein
MNTRHDNYSDELTINNEDAMYARDDARRKKLEDATDEALAAGHKNLARGISTLKPDPAHDTTGNGTESHYELARQLEMRGYRVDPDEEDNEHSYVRFGESDDIIADISGDEVATVTNR